MTTYHDPAPSSRRAVRQSERDASDREQGFPIPLQPTPFAQAASHPPHAPSHGPQAPRGRRAANPVPEPLTYVTQGAQQVSHHDGPSFVQRELVDIPETQAIPTSERPTYRPRDFSPEGRRAAAPVEVPALPRQLEYQTQNRPSTQEAAPVAFVPPVFAPPAAVPPAPQQELPRADQGPSEHTLTRRELRELLRARERGESADSAPIVEPAPIEQPAAVTPVPVEVPELVVPDPVPEHAPTAPVIDVPPRAVEESPASTWTAPANHWSRQLAVDEATQPFESTVNRVVGSSHTTTSALVLPTIPQGDIRGALTNTGEVMLTGSIEVPREYAATGSSIQLEHSGIDALFEEGDSESVATDSAPIRATRAVSSHTESTLSPGPRPKGTRAITVLLVSACGLAVGVTGLVVAAFVFNLL